MITLHTNVPSKVSKKEDQSDLPPVYLLVTPLAGVVVVVPLVFNVDRLIDKTGILKRKVS